MNKYMDIWTFASLPSRIFTDFYYRLVCVIRTFHRKGRFEKVVITTFLSAPKRWGLLDEVIVEADGSDRHFQRSNHQKP